MIGWSGGGVGGIGSWREWRSAARARRARGIGAAGFELVEIDDATGGAAGGFELAGANGRGGVAVARVEILAGLAKPGDGAWKSLRGEDAGAGLEGADDPIEERANLGLGAPCGDLGDGEPELVGDLGEIGAKGLQEALEEFEVGVGIDGGRGWEGHGRAPGKSQIANGKSQMEAETNGLP